MPMHTPSSVRLLSALIAGLTVAAAAPTTGCQAEPPTLIVHTASPTATPRQVAVTGTATLEVSPDCADLTLTLSATARKSGAAAAEVRAQQARLLAALAKAEVGLEDVKLAQQTISPQHEWVGDRQRFLGHQAAITLTVTTRKFELIGDLMELAAEAGATVTSTQFRRSDLDTLKTKVRTMALEAAKTKAAQIATTLDLTLGAIVGVVEANPSYVFSNTYFPRVANIAEASDAPGPALGGELQPLTLEVTLTYELPSKA